MPIFQYVVMSAIDTRELSGIRYDVNHSSPRPSISCSSFLTEFADASQPYIQKGRKNQMQTAKQHHDSSIQDHDSGQFITQQNTLTSHRINQCTTSLA